MDKFTNKPRVYSDAVVVDKYIYIMGGLENPQSAYTEENSLGKYAHRAYAQRYYNSYTCDIIIHKLEKYGIGKYDFYGEASSWTIHFLQNHLPNNPEGPGEKAQLPWSQNHL